MIRGFAMTILTLCECDGCGDRLPTPQDDGSAPFDTITVSMGSSRAGGAVQSFEGHLCPQCIVDLQRSLDVSRWPRPRRVEASVLPEFPFVQAQGGDGASL